MAKKAVERGQLEELLYQALETEMGGVTIYETALTCAVNDDLKKEWTEYLEQTKRHEQVVLDVLEQLGLDPLKMTPGRRVVKLLGQSLVNAIVAARENAPADAAQIVAGECVTLAETKDHLNWELIGHCAKNMKGEEAAILKAAYEEVEDQEDEHIYHSKGWTRELWIEHLGLPAVLPPPEERKHVETAIGAARAENARGKMLRDKH
jgi:hypothetical protein